MQHRWAVITGVLLLSLTLGACATIIEGSDQTVTVITEPPGAVCTFTRGNATVGVANPTPASVHLEKSKDNISILCQKDGYFDGAAAFASELEAMTLGNIIFGGIIGVGVDAVSGAMHEYPESITIILAPTAFSSATNRDAFFDRQRARIEREAEAVAAELNRSCDQKTQNCEALARAIDDARDAELRELERQREATRIGVGE